MEKNIWQSFSQRVYFLDLKSPTNFTINLIVYCFASMKSINKGLFFNVRTLENIGKIMDTGEKIKGVLSYLFFFFYQAKKQILSFEVVHFYKFR